MIGLWKALLPTAVTRMCWQFALRLRLLTYGLGRGELCRHWDATKKELEIPERVIVEYELVPLNPFRKEIAVEGMASVEELEKKIEGLAPEDQLRLLETLARHLRKTALSGPRDELNWADLYGLGKNLWKGEDAQEYVDRSRENRI